MSDEEVVGSRRRRTRVDSTTARSEALKLLKARQSGEARGKFQVKMDEPIYDQVDDDEYEALIKKRREENQGFIVDDDGLGYGDDGQEEDWSLAGGPPSSDESDGGADKEKPKRKKSNLEKKDARITKKASQFSAAAALHKNTISNLLTTALSKNRESKNSFSDSIVDNVIAEYTPDESDREKRRRGNSSISFNNSKNFAPSISNIIPVQIEKKVNVDRLIHNPTIFNQSNGLTISKTDESGVKDLGKECGNGETVSDNKVNEVELNDFMVKECSNKEEADPVMAKKKDDVFTLNAKVEEKSKDPSLSATAGWQALKPDASKVNHTLKAEEKSDLELDSDGSLPFYILDAHEEIYGANAGNLYLFGKVRAGGNYQSCCVVVKNMQRCVYAIPKESVFSNDDILKLERDLDESKISVAAFRAQLHEMASGLKTEISQKLMDCNVSSFSMTPVKRNYAFERSDIPLGENYVLKINYPFKDPPLPQDLKGEEFCALLGTHTSALELFLIKRKIKGPSWVSLSKFSICAAPQRVSWCKFEVTIDDPKDLKDSSSSKHAIEIPPVIVTAINLKTTINEKQNINEIVSASVVCCHKAKIETPMLASEWSQPGVLSHFTVVRKLDGGIFPMGFAKDASEKNLKAGSNVTICESSERALLNRLMLELHKLDSDVLVGHNISGFDLDILLHRVQACRVPSVMWSKIGRLKRSVMPKLTKNSTIFGSGASPGIMSCIAGRLLCDTYLCSRDLLKEVSYSLTELVKTQLRKDRMEITPQEIPRMFQSSESLMELIEYGETDAWLSMELMFHLSVLPLTRQLTNISGNLWGKTLQGARAQRVEYFLLHSFHAKKFMVPDKFYARAKEVKTNKRKSGVEVKEDNNNVEIDETEMPENEQVKTRKGPAYSGGLVLEPKKGLYDKYILLLDFNSLYPSIIQEYNICFTTVERSGDVSMPSLPSSTKTGILPELLKYLVERRKSVKSMLKTATGLKVQQLDIQQQALKLTANSIYGCLGFSNSRFYAKPLAELITLQGREILQSTVDLVRNNLNLEVIYGDTDSIMIYSGLDNIAKAKATAVKVIQEVNKKYKCLEIDLDGLYKRMLLLKKKKYAAVKVQFKDGVPYEVIERKGLDIVRRDWSLLAKELGDFCLSQVLSGRSCEDVVESIHNALMKVHEDMRNGQIALEKYVITKTLTKPPEAYPDAKSQPHVEVALRMKKNGYVTGCSVGDTIPYIICSEQGNSSTTSKGIAQRAKHPDEVKKDNDKYMVDIDYYLAQQIHPVVSRLCGSIEGTSSARLADCLGLDSSKFQSKSGEGYVNDTSALVLSTADDEERYRGCEALTLSCPSCSERFECAPIYSSIGSNLKESEAKEAVNSEAAKVAVNNVWIKLRCPKCPEEGDLGKISPALIENQVKRQAEVFISTYYKSFMMCDDETCKYATRGLNLRAIGDSDRGTVCPNYPHCNGHLLRKYTEADLYKQLSYFCHILDTIRCIDKVEIKMRPQIEKEMAKVRPLVESAASTVQKMRDRCAYGWVQLQDLSITI